MVPVKVMISPRYTSDTRGAVDGDGFWGLEAASGSNSDASMQRVETK